VNCPRCGAHHNDEHWSSCEGEDMTEQKPPENDGINLTLEDFFVIMMSVLLAPLFWCWFQIRKLWR
jgi:hypothetical protein